MLIEAYMTYEWWELWKIVSMRDGCIYKTENTGKHIRNDQTPPEGYITVSISAKPGEFVEIFEFTP